MMRTRRHLGFTLIELLLAIALGALILTTITSVMSQLTGSRTAIDDRNRLAEDARFAMNRMVRAVREARQLMLPQPDKPDTDWREHVREETIPASPPEGSSSKATAVLALTVGLNVDLDADGFPDADNDRDGRIDEDYPADIVYDFNPGIHLIDDGGNGLVDDGTTDDDDEQLSANDEDPINGIDDDVDGLIDEDPGADMNGDGSPGVAGVDDDGDGQIDEGSADDDDEDGSNDEDWLDAVVFYLQGDSLIERHPVPWDETENGFVSGRDFIESAIAEDVTRFRVERIASGQATDLVEITLELGNAGQTETVSLQTRIRVGGAL